MRHQAATVHELARVAELSVLPGETLTKLARELERHELRPGEKLTVENQFAVVLSGLVTGPEGVLHPGDRVHGHLRALTPAAVATCDQAAYEAIARSGA